MYKPTAKALAAFGIVVLMASALAATSAALPKVLNEHEAELKQAFSTTPEKSTMEFSILGGFGVTRCFEITTEGEIEAGRPLGPFHILFGDGCTTNLGGTCTGLGSVSGNILMLGSLHLVFDTLGAVLSQAGVAALFLLQRVHYECTVAGIEKLILVLGKVLCLLSPVNTLIRKYTVSCLGTGGDPKEVRYWNEGGTQVNIAEGLLSSENEGVTYQMAAQQGEGKFEFPVERVEIRT